MTNPYRLPNKPKLTIRQIVAWASKQREPFAAAALVDAFGITANDAAVRVMKLHRWGYFRRRKAKLPPRIYKYALSAFGRRTAKRWK